MALNEHEQRVLAELERGLYADDEQLARRMQKAAAQTEERQKQSSAAKRIAGILIAVAGLGVILVGAIIHWPWMGAAGFVITLTGLALATGALSKPSDEGVSFGKPNKTAPSGGQAKPKTPKSYQDRIQSLNDFFEDKWNRRGL